MQLLLLRKIRVVLLVNRYCSVKQLFRSIFQTAGAEKSVDSPDKGSGMSAIASQSSRLSFHLFNLHSCCFHFRQEEILGVIWSGFPTHLLSSLLLTQWSRTQAICQGVKLCLAARNIYPNIYISYYCLYITSVDLSICYLFLENIHFLNLPLFWRKFKKKTLSPCILGQS